MSQTDIRAAIVTAMARQKMSRNQLAVAVEGQVSRSHVYDYVDGTFDMGTEKVTHLMKVLGLKVVGK